MAIHIKKTFKVKCIWPEKLYLTKIIIGQWTKYKEYEILPIKINVLLIKFFFSKKLLFETMIKETPIKGNNVIKDGCLISLSNME